RSRCRTAETGTAFWANSSQQVKTPSRFDRFSLCGRRFLSFGISSPPRVCYGKKQHPGGPTDRSRCTTAETGTAFWANASQQVKTPSRLTDSRFAAADSSLSVSRARQEFVMGRDSIQAVLPSDLGAGQKKRGPRFGPIPHSRSKRAQGLPILALRPPIPLFRYLEPAKSLLWEETASRRSYRSISVQDSRNGDSVLGQFLTAGQNALKVDRFSLCGRRFRAFGILSPPRVCYGKRQHPGGPTDRSRCRTAETGTAFWANSSQLVKTPSRLTDSRFAAADSSLSVSRARQEFVMGRDSIQAVLPIDLGAGQQKRGPRFGPIPHSRSKRPQGCPILALRPPIPLFRYLEPAKSLLWEETASRRSYRSISVQESRNGDRVLGQFLTAGQNVLKVERFSLCGRRFLSCGISSPPRVCYGKRQHPGGPTDRSRCRTAETGTAFWANSSQQVKTPSRLT